MSEYILGEIQNLRDEKYASFQAKLIPTIDPAAIIGVRTPDLRALARRLRKEGAAAGFLEELPHTCFDENQLHAFLLSEEKSFAVCIEQVDRFLPYVDNWATCDQLSPKVFRKHTEELLPDIRKWIRSDRVYTVRFAIGMLMQHFLDERFDPVCVEWVAAVRSEEYYINMMIAWYFATALAKQYGAVLPYLEKRRLAIWTHNKAIQKSLESYRITPEQKVYLRTLKIRPASGR